ncbi:MFS transporter [Streptomyces albidoflavus]|uniref:MFS transporter n=1 Tax=Streptomyces TaxID=1883 RepID=UPI00063E91F4|nr:MFS transporter [Streptomyces sp. KE1]KLI90912.1 membrane protein [Streptomyces sp. KE1]
MTTTPRTARHLLRDREASLILGAVLVSGFGSSATALVAGVWVKELTASDSLAALATAALWAAVPAAPWLGALADRFPRRHLLVATDLAAAALLLLLAATAAPGRLWLILTVLVLYGVCGTVHDAAGTALAATTLDARLLGAFNGLRLTANEGMKLLAPLTGAALFTWYGGPAVALLDALTFLCAATLYTLLRAPDPVPEPRPRHRPRGPLLPPSPTLRALVTAGACTMLLAGVNGASLYTVVDAGLGRAPSWAGVLYAVQGAGSVATGLAAGTLLRRLGERGFAAGGCALFGLGVAARALPGDAPVLAGSLLIGAGLPCVLIAALTAVQRETPADRLGVTAGRVHTLLYAPNAAALVAGAGLVAVTDHRVLLTAAGAAALGCAAVAARGRGVRSGEAEEVPGR